MLKKKIRNVLSRNANNYRGWRTNRKIVVIESDDWGSICMPSRESYNSLVEKGFRVDLCPYASYDSLATEEDLAKLFSLLKSFKDYKGNHPVITANSVVANPDFEKIRENGFRKYFFEPFTETLKRYPEETHGRSFDRWKEGMSQNLFFPQFHGREHIYIKLWLNLLRDEKSDYRSVFGDKITWLGSYYDRPGGSLRAAFEAAQLSELDSHTEIMKNGLELFEEIFGYRSKSFIAPNYVWHPNLNNVLYNTGIHTIQGMKYQNLPKLGSGDHQRIRHIQGEKNDIGQVHLVRNCIFEPSQYSSDFDNTGECLKGIRNAFLWKKPAVISAHRLNFIGHVQPGNRRKNLLQLKELLSKTIKRWPDVEFMTSVELGELIRKQ